MFVTKTSWTNFSSRAIWNLSLIGPVVSEEKMFENVDGRQSDWYTISSPMSLRLRWANNTNDPQKDHLRMVSKYILLEGLNQCHGAPTSPFSSDVDQDT